MTEPTDRADCPVPGCGKNIAVNKDGSLRKHECVGTEPETERVDQGADVEPPAAGPEPEQLHTTAAPAAEPLHTTRAEPEQLQTRPRRRYCRVANCGRAPRPDGLCPTHRLHTHLLP